MNTKSKRVVLASNNAGKLKEFSAILAQAGISMIPQGQLNIPEAEEPFATFIENALAKARHA
ncbi:non-canonical purine NTP pyrophosphatase, partial [Providencia rettgeri]|nr:non-canonical purine NTP pyrophosphatase [Providencia rettgeri]